MYSRIKGYNDQTVLYFPDYEDTPDYIPPKKYMWDIFATLDYDLAWKFVDHAMKKRNTDEDEKEKTVEIDEEIYKEMMNSNYFSKKKGTAINMLAVAKISKKIQRKRKRQIDPYNPFEREMPDKRMKRSDSPKSESMIRNRNPFLLMQSRSKINILTQDEIDAIREEEQDKMDEEINSIYESKSQM